MLKRMMIALIILLGMAVLTEPALAVNPAETSALRIIVENPYSDNTLVNIQSFSRPAAMQSQHK